MWCYRWVIVIRIYPTFIVKSIVSFTRRGNFVFYIPPPPISFPLASHILEKLSLVLNRWIMHNGEIVDDVSHRQNERSEKTKKNWREDVSLTSKNAAEKKETTRKELKNPQQNFSFRVTHWADSQCSLSDFCLDLFPLSSARFKFRASQSEWKLKISHKSNVRENEKWKKNKSQSRQWNARGKVENCRVSFKMLDLLPPRVVAMMLRCMLLLLLRNSKNLENLIHSIPIEKFFSLFSRHQRTWHGIKRAFWCVTKPTRISAFSRICVIFSPRVVDWLGLAAAGLANSITITSPNTIVCLHEEFQQKNPSARILEHFHISFQSQQKSKSSHVLNSRWIIEKKTSQCFYLPYRKRKKIPKNCSKILGTHSTESNNRADSLDVKRKFHHVLGSISIMFAPCISSSCCRCFISSEFNFYYISFGFF